MNGGVKFLGCAALLAIAACGGEGAKLEVRAMKTPLAQGKKTVSFRVAEAHSQLAMGNVALALEAYRIALREDPKSVDALAGMAVCYERMGRFDLSRRQYEAALAIEPGSQTILAMLAASLDQQGMRSEAAAVRAEINQRSAALAVAPAAETPVATVAAEVAEIVELALPKPAEVPLPMLTSAPLAAGAAIVAPVVAVAAFAANDPPAPVPVAKPKSSAEPLAVADAANVGRSVTVTLPAARPAPQEIKAAALPVKMAAIVKPVVLREAPKAAAPALVPASIPSPLPAPVPIRTAQDKPVALPPPVRRLAANSPRLERVSLGEVELVTREAPRWASLLVKQEQKSATVRFVPLKQFNTRFASVRLLNAARVGGLAARARATLFERGWRGIAIGDAGAVRARSVVLYPNHRRATALSLARQFGFQAAQRSAGREITVLLGRDAAKMPRGAATD